jgi:hypothetical protein
MTPEIRFEIEAPEHGKHLVKAFQGDELLAQERFDIYQSWQTKPFLQRVTGALPCTNGYDNFDDSVAFVAGDFDEAVRNLINGKQEAKDRFMPILFGELQDRFPTLKPPQIHELLRRGESANVVSVSKVGKSWLMGHLSLCTITGRKFLDTFQCEPARVLYIDNELHPPTIAFRIATVAEAMGIEPDQYRIGLDVLPLRGKRLDLYGVANELEKIEPGMYGVIIADAYYRFQPPGHNENDNSATMALYNLMDSITERLQCSWVNVHHTSKGAQGDKRVSDVGSGAGSQSRAADSHLVLREHEEDGAVVFDAVVRSFPPIEPVVLRWQFPLWRPDSSLDAGKLKGKLTASEQRQSARDDEGITKLAAAFSDGPATISILRGRSGLSKDRCQRLLDMLESKGSVKWTLQKIRGNTCRVYEAINLDDLNGSANEPF